MTETHINISQNLLPHLKAMPGASVLVVGDIMLDRFVYGDVDRISPESPVPVLRVKREKTMLGGAGNVLANLVGLGIKAKIVSLIGSDDPGKDVTRELEDLGVASSGVVRSETRPTTVKTRFLASNQQLLRSDYEETEPLSEDNEQRLLSSAQSALETVQAVILSDYGKGVLTRSVIAAIIKTCNEKNIPVLVDPKGNDFSKYEGATLITPNKKELAAAINMPTNTDGDVVLAGLKLLEQVSLKSLVITRAAEGMTVLDNAKEPVHIRNKPVEVFDVSGAGDTSIAVIAAALAVGAPLEDAARLANVAGGIVVSKIGTAAIRTADIEKALQEEDEAGIVHKAPICKGNEALEHVERWRARGLKIGFTNGCFDILHYGHVSYLGKAREQCDRLIVALNSDASVKRLKGPERPVNDEDSRSGMLSLLGMVDMVVVFGDNAEENDTPIQVIETLQPDIYFKGGDYKEDQIPEAKIVRAYGGEVSITPLYEGYSTTGTIERIKTA